MGAAGGGTQETVSTVSLADCRSLLDVATGPSDVDIPGFRTHRLKGRLSGHWSIWVTDVWRETFRFNDSDVELVDYLDYH